MEIRREPLAEQPKIGEHELDMPSPTHDMFRKMVLDEFAGQRFQLMRISMIGFIQAFVWPGADNIRITEGDNYGAGGAVLWDMPESRTCSAFVIRNAHKAQEGNVLATEPYCRETVSR